MKPYEIHDGNFETEVLGSQVPVLVDFWAPWCAPCRLISPVLEEIAQEYEGRVKIVKMNTDSNTTAMNYHIRSIPTMLLFKDGQVVDQIVGAVPKKQITDKLNYFSYDASVLN